MVRYLRQDVAARDNWVRHDGSITGHGLAMSQIL